MLLAVAEDLLLMLKEMVMEEVPMAIVHSLVDGKVLVFLVFPAELKLQDMLSDKGKMVLQTQ